MAFFLEKKTLKVTNLFSRRAPSAPRYDHIGVLARRRPPLLLLSWLLHRRARADAALLLMLMLLLLLLVRLMEVFGVVESPA